jgi:Biopolymer transport protein ExbD/TolR
MRDVSEVRIVAAPNVTPMIDVMLVLLIIFMVVTPSLLSGVVAEPPQSENFKARPEIETDHTLAIDAGGALYGRSARRTWARRSRACIRPGLTTACSTCARTASCGMRASPGSSTSPVRAESPWSGWSPSSGHPTDLSH